MHRVVESIKANLLGCHGIVAVSGGADSVALLRACHELGVAVTVAHVNHQLRGAESDGDEAFVAELAAQLKLPFVSTRITLPSVGIEAAAREARYEWLRNQVGSWIATGHTADDQAETVLFRIIRGTGLKGLRGIVPDIGCGALEEHSVIHPLLSITRAEVIDYLQSLRQSYRHDTSNDDPRFTRNRIRHELIPLLKSFNPDVVAAVNRMAKQATESYHFLAFEAEKLLEKAEMPRAGTMVVLNREFFTSLYALTGDSVVYHPLCVREMFRVLWAREKWSQNRMTFEHWDFLTRLIRPYDDFHDANFPGGIRVRRVGHVLQIGPKR